VHRLRSLALSVTCVLALLFTARSSRAQDYTHKSFLIPRGGVALEGDPARPLLVDINVSENSAFQPVTVPLNVLFGVSDDVTLGIVHERGPCFNHCGRGFGEPGDAQARYNDAGFGILVRLTESHRLELDLNAGVPIHSFDPFVIGTRVGVLGRVNFSNVAFVFDPGVYVGLNRRDRGNGDGLFLPFWFYFQATETVVPFVGSGAMGPLNGFADGFRVPIEGGMLFSVSRNVDIGFMLGFGNALGHGGNLRGRDIGFLGRFVF
jgi:hypothetical protein